MPISLKSTVGGGGIPIGSMVEFDDFMPSDFEQDGCRYLRSGYIETDTSNFDNSLFSETIGSIYNNVLSLPLATNLNDWVVASADNGTNTIVAIRGVNGTTTQFYVSIDSGITWQILTIPVGSIKANDIIWVSSLSLFVVVLDFGKIMTSPNGTTWTTRYNVSGDGDITGIAFGAGRLVAVSNGNKVITSTNGTSWAYATTVPATTNITDVAFGNGKFFITALSNQCLISSDGNTWTIQSMGLGVNTNIDGIGFGNGVFLASTTSTAVDNGIYNMFTSVDGITWVKGNPNIPNFEKYGVKTRLKYSSGFWFSHTKYGTSRSRDTLQWTPLYSNTFSPQGARPYVYPHISKWVSFVHSYDGSIQTVVGTSISFGNSYLYAGVPTFLYGFTQITDSGAFLNRRFAKYMRIS